MPEQELASPLELLYQVSRELASALELRPVLQSILFQSLKSVGGERASVVVMDEKGKAVDATIVFGHAVHENSTQTLRETIERGLAGWVVRHRQAVWVPDTSQDERWLQRPDDAAERSGAKAALCVPLLVREELVGVLTLVHPEPGAYNNKHLELMQAIADLAGIAVLNARLYADSQRQARVMTVLAGSAAAINVTVGKDEVLQRILNETIQALQVETVALALADPAGDLVFEAATGEYRDAIIGQRIPSGRGLAAWVVKDGHGLVIPHVLGDNRLVAEERFDRPDLHSLAMAPIYAQGRGIGILEAINPRAGVFDPDTLLVITGIANLAGPAIQHAQLFERLQATHKRYRDLFEDSMDPILITGWDGKIYETNRQAAALSGFTPQELNGMPIVSLHEPARDVRTLSKGKLMQGQTLSYDSVLKSKSGDAIPIQVHVRRLIFEETESLQWLMRDVTERRNLDLLREDLTSMVYHDLRSPLANIVSSLDVLKALFYGKENETVESVVSIARRSTERIQRLVSSLLDLNRLESGQPIVTQQAIAPLVLIGEAVEAVRPMTDNRHQSLIYHVPENLPLIMVDTDMIRRVLINLLENASKFAPLNGKIETSAIQEGDWVQFWVQDNGPGIPIADQERIFDKFTRLKEKDGPGGLGMGLAFCRLAAHGHGGKVWVESKSGQGARFLLALPVVK
jgi:PAS domain S-box-containing protein